MGLLNGRHTAVDRRSDTSRRDDPAATPRPPRPPRRDPRALVACALALLAVGGGLALALAHADQRRSGTNGVFGQAQAQIPAGSAACQAGEQVPAGTTGVRIAGVSERPPVVSVRSGGRLIDRGIATVDRRHGLIEAPIAQAARGLTDAEICLAFEAPASVVRGPTPPHVGTLDVGGAIAGSSMEIDYLMGGQRSWWAFAPTVAARVGRGRGDWGGGWTAWSIAGLLAASFVLTGTLVWRTLVTDLPMRRVAGAVMAVAILNAGAWSMITPAFRVPDEVAHVAYVQSLGETGKPPADPPAMRLSPEQATVMADAGFGRVEARTYGTAVWSPREQQRLAAELHRPLSRRQTVPAGEAEPEPPLYYALEALSYRAASGQTLLDRILLMRLLSASLAGVTALLCFLFVRECLPERPWAWTVGGLSIALMPMLGSVSGGVNPDALLFAIAAALFLCVARAWRRGVTLGLALVVGGLIGAGLLTKVNFLGLLPGTLLALALAARRPRAGWGRRLRLVGAGLGLAVALFAAGAAFELLAWHHPLVVGRTVAPESHVGLWSHVGYIWQVFLPRLPFQPETNLTDPGYVQLFQTFVGAFGELTAWFPSWVYEAAAAGLVLTALLAVRALVAEPRELRWRRGEIVGYVAMAIPLLLLIGLSADLRRHLIGIVQGRYLLPLLPLLGLLLAVGARGAGERWGRAAGVAIVSSVAGLSLLGQLVTIAFFYS